MLKGNRVTNPGEFAVWRAFRHHTESSDDDLRIPVAGPSSPADSSPSERASKRKRRRISSTDERRLKALKVDIDLTQEDEEGVDIIDLTQDD